MVKSFHWEEPGREKLELSLTIEEGQVTDVQMKSKGCLHFLSLSQQMKAKLKGEIGDLLPPTGSDHSSMIWREMIASIQSQWALPVKQDELCHCRKISTERVDRSIVFGAHTVEEVRKRTSANTGCGTCKSDVELMIENRLKIK